MDIKTFKNKFEEAFYLRIRANINNILNLNDNDITSLGLFLHLPIKIDVKKVKIFPPKEFSTQDKNLLFFQEHFSAYIILNDEKTFSFGVKFLFIYQNNDELLKLYESLNFEIVREYLSFIYLQQLQFVLKRYKTKATQSVFKGIIDKFLFKNNKTLSDEDKDNIINISFEYAVNYSLLQIMKISFKDAILYNQKFVDCQMSDFSILYDLLENLDDIKTNNSSKKNSNLQNQIIETPSSIVTKHYLKSDEIYLDDIEIDDNIEIELQDLANVLGDFIQQKIRGSSSQEITQKLGISIKTNIDWVKEIIASLLMITRDITHQYISTWSSLKNQYRRIGKFPKKKFLKKTTWIYVSIDQSGSMSDEELRKINYILEVVSKKVDYLEVLIHDYSIVKVLKFGNKSGNKFNLKLDKLRTRYARGGTSHKDIFQYLDENIKNKDIAQIIYLSFSDNESDIEENYKNYKIIQKIRKFWITTDKMLNNIKGKQIKIR